MDTNNTKNLSKPKHNIDKKNTNKLFNMYLICINDVLPHKKELCVDLLLTDKYRNVPWTF